MDWFLPVVFYFNVKFQGNPPIGEVAFKSVLGLDTEMEFESVKEGGVNNFEYKLPKQVKHGNLILKRAMMPIENNLGNWIKEILENTFEKPVQTRNVIITLLNEDGDPMYYWTCANAYPVKWNVEGFDAEKNEVAIESLELSYSTLKRGQ
ncbi:MAG: phage tail protein [Dysgonamonadaceae bacterium]|jgi:phage tail-like protein|nr:phage tail protein [Dysgonamonadaceae bacterium]